MLSNLSPRQTYLKRIGLTHDPFRHQVAEQEQHSIQYFDQPTLPIPSKTRFPLYSYFTLPQSRAVPSNQTFLTVLRQPQPAFVYAPHGSGKSTLRFLLEAECRTVLDNSLVVTYTLGEEMRSPLTLQRHLARLGHALAVDFFIQVVEQFKPSADLTQDQVFALGHQLMVGGHQLQRVAEAIINRANIQSRGNAAVHFNLINKAALRYVPYSDELVQLIQQAMAVKQDYVPAHEYKHIFQEGLRATRLWGFERVLILVDGVDVRDRSIETMTRLVSPLVKPLARWNREQVYFKFFLPSELEPNINELLQEQKKPLQPKEFTARIVWDEKSLVELLEKRFQAASSLDLPPISFGALAGAGLEGKLYDLLARSARKSPRRMLLLVDELIRWHVARNPEQEKFTAEDWNLMRNKWSYEEPLPLSL